MPFNKLGTGSDALLALNPAGAAPAPVVVVGAVEAAAGRANPPVFPAVAFGGAVMVKEGVGVGVAAGLAPKRDGVEVEAGVEVDVLFVYQDIDRL